MGQGAGGILVVIAAIWFFFWIVGVIVNAIVVMAGFAIGGVALCLGLLSFVMAKTGKALVPQPGAGPALFASVSWAATLGLGCIIGSFGLAWACTMALGQEFGVLMLSRERALGDGDMVFWMRVVDWLARDALVFVANVTCVLYLANRIHLARTEGGSRWLGVIPPAFAMTLFFCVQHWEKLLRLLQTRSQADADIIIAAATQEMRLPFELMVQAVIEPQAALAWAHDALMTAEGSVFRLGAYFPSVFCVVALVVAGRSLFTSSDAAAA